MFKIFEGKYSRDSTPANGRMTETFTSGRLELSQFFAEYGGASFEEGLYRIVDPNDIYRWHERICLAFPDFSERITCFAFDWSGGVFALDTARLEEGQAGVVLFEPGTGKALRIPSNLQTFHENGLIEFGEAVLGISFYEQWRATGGTAPDYDQCVGYRKPLFLGGLDEVNNLEVSDIDVYWHLVGQLIDQTQGLPPGTRVRLNLE